MRLCTRAFLCLAAAVAVLPGVAPAYAATPLPACTPEEDHSFPLTARIHGGPASYTAGGGFGTWRLALTNTTGRPCTGVHPVVVLVDEKRALKPAQPQLEFYDAGGRPHPVRFEATDRDELVGAFADEDAGFPGFGIGPGKTLTVKIRLALTSDTVPNEVTVNAAVVQRRDDDGDWVGQSNDYRFRIDHDTGPGPEPEPKPESQRESEAESQPESEPQPQSETESQSQSQSQPQSEAEPQSQSQPQSEAESQPESRRDSGAFPFPEELAPTGTGAQLLAVAAAALLTGVLALLLSRRRP
ncbi:hypothetical protein GCM10010294_01580 [Streptomyces griseoloalbus]|uniref:hypothetical protein n=1 Tax=Streptomyces griseoloalbus TaxID=67303 RepID=UPI0019BBB935|nr:hypothetical protein GCM10010294_01580 [Streptomyces griseoloalbus]